MLPGQVSAAFWLIRGALVYKNCCPWHTVCLTADAPTYIHEGGKRFPVDRCLSPHSATKNLALNLEVGQQNTLSCEGIVA